MRASYQLLHYLELNSPGYPAVILLHGLGAIGESWGMQFPILIKAGFRIIAPDARGFGKSPYPGGSHSVADMAQDVVCLMDSLGLPRAHIVGISMGGTTALQMALDHPQYVDRLVLVNTFARLRPKQLRGWLYFLLRFTLIHTLGLPAQGRAVVKRLFPKPEQEQLRQMLYDQIIQADPRGYRATMRALGRFNQLERLALVSAPTLVVTAENDSTVHPENQRPLAQGIPGAQHIVIPDAGHAVIAEQPEAFNQALVAFLTGEG